MLINLWYNMLGFMFRQQVIMFRSDRVFLFIWSYSWLSFTHAIIQRTSVKAVLISPSSTPTLFRFRWNQIKSNLTPSLNAIVLWRISYRQMNETEPTIKLSGNVMGHLSNDWSAMADKRKQNQYSSFCDSIAKLHLLIMTAANEEASVTPRATPSELA